MYSACSDKILNQNGPSKIRGGVKRYISRDSRDPLCDSSSITTHTQLFYILYLIQVFMFACQLN